jgi:hypothetical protein
MRRQSLSPPLAANRESTKTPDLVIARVSAGLSNPNERRFKAVTETPRERDDYLMTRTAMLAIVAHRAGKPRTRNVWFPPLLADELRS